MMPRTRGQDVDAVHRQCSELVLQLRPAGIEAAASPLRAAAGLLAGSALARGDHGQREIAEVSCESVRLAADHVEGEQFFREGTAAPRRQVQGRPRTGRRIPADGWSRPAPGRPPHRGTAACTHGRSCRRESGRRARQALSAFRSAENSGNRKRVTAGAVTLWQDAGITLRTPPPVGTAQWTTALRDLENAAQLAGGEPGARTGTDAQVLRYLRRFDTHMAAATGSVNALSHSGGGGKPLTAFQQCVQAYEQHPSEDAQQIVPDTPGCRVSPVGQAKVTALFDAARDDNPATVTP